MSFLSRYFTAINSHDYDAYQRLFSVPGRDELSVANFNSGYATSRDSRAVLHSVSVVGPGQLAVLVTFTSHQQPAASPTHTSCTAWSISLYLIRREHRYLMQSPPGNYGAFASSCS